MILSCYDYRSKLWHYFEVEGTYDRSTRYRALNQKPQGSPQLGGIGYAPEALGIPLPAGARQVGTGKVARGVVAFDTRGTKAALGEMVPAMPGRWEERGGTLSGVGDLGEEITVQSVATPFVQVVAAACIASVVGVMVQRALKKSEKR